MKKDKKLLLLLILFILLPNVCSAVQVTSPYGWRTHPITGDRKFHNGIDLGFRQGQELPDVLPGVIKSAGWNDGFGNCVIIDHVDGSQTLYAHLETITVFEGQTVAPGMEIGTCGSTGNSTGPHLHFGYYAPSGEAVDPYNLLVSHNWDLQGGDDPLVTNDGSNFYNSDYDELPWDFGNFYDIAAQIRVILEKCADSCITGLFFLQNKLSWLLTILILIDFSLSASLGLLDGEDWMRFLIKKLLLYGFIIYLVENWDLFINNFILDLFSNSAITAGGGNSEIADNISDPSKIVQKGIYLAQPAFAYISQFSGPRQLANFHLVLLALILTTGIVASFLIIGLHFFIAYLEFYVISILSIVQIPFGVLKQTKWLGERSLGAAIGAGIKIMVMTFTVAVIVHSVKDFTQVAYDPVVYLRVLLLSMGLAFLIHRVSGTVGRLLTSGLNPKL